MEFPSFSSNLRLENGMRTSANHPSSLITVAASQAMDYFEKAYEEGSGPLGHVSLEVIQHPELADNQRYVALLKKMNLPLKEASD